jgi:hypothetical protein
MATTTPPSKPRPAAAVVLCHCLISRPAHQARSSLPPSWSLRMRSEAVGGNGGLAGGRSQRAGPRPGETALSNTREAVGRQRGLGAAAWPEQRGGWERQHGSGHGRRTTGSDAVTGVVGEVFTRGVKEEQLLLCRVAYERSSSISDGSL